MLSRLILVVVAFLPVAFFEESLLQPSFKSDASLLDEAEESQSQLSTGRELLQSSCRYVSRYANYYNGELLNGYSGGDILGLSVDYICIGVRNTGRLTGYYRLDFVIDGIKEDSAYISGLKSGCVDYGCILPVFKNLYNNVVQVKLYYYFLGLYTLVDTKTFYDVCDIVRC